jgi:hypothetical protein
VSAVTLAHRLAAYIAEHGLDQTTVAPRLDTNQQAVSRWLKGSRPLERSWPQIAALLDLTLEQVEQIMPSKGRKRMLGGSADTVRSIGRVDLRSHTRDELFAENRGLRMRVSELEGQVRDLAAENGGLMKVLRDLSGRSGTEDYRSGS